MKYTPLFFLVGLLFLTNAEFYQSDYGNALYQNKWALTFFIMCYWFAVDQIQPKFGWPAAILFVYMLGNAAWFWLAKENRYFRIKPYDQMAIRYFVADASAKLLAVVVPIVVAAKTGFWNREKMLTAGGILASHFCLFNTALVLYSFFAYGGYCTKINSCGGAIGNPSMNASMMVVTMPFLWRWAKPIGPILCVPVIAAILIQKSSIGYGLLGVLGGMYLWTTRWKWFLMAPLVAVLGYGHLTMQAGELLNPSDRFIMWKFFMSYWDNKKIHLWFGTGYGDFGVMSRVLQDHYGMSMKGWWHWLHNDWLEVLFMTGFVGLGLCLLNYLWAMYGFWRHKNNHELASLVLFGITMCLNYPGHIGVSAVFGAWLILCGLLKSDTSNWRDLCSKAKKLKERLAKWVTTAWTSILSWKLKLPLVSRSIS